MHPRLERLLASDRSPALAAVIGALVSAPAIATGLQVDDWFHLAAMRGVQPFEGWTLRKWHLFTFFDGVPEHCAHLRSIGVLPWWSDPAIKLEFFRPLSVLTHFFDHWVLHDVPWLMHVHSIAWYALLVAIAAALYRRVLGATFGAGLAALLYAVDDAHAVGAAWIANRNAVVAGVFALLAVLLHDRAARDRSKIAAVLAPISFAAALGAGEGGIAAFAWLLAHALFLDRDDARRRALRLVPYAAVLACWLFAWRAWGAGAHGSAIYSDPVHHPLRFLGELPARFLLLLGNVLANTPIDFVIFSKKLEIVLLAVSALVACAAVMSLRRVLRTSASARFFAFGMALSIVPACAVVTSARLTVIAGFGAFGLVAELLARAGSIFERRTARTAVALHAILAPLSFVFLTQQFAIVGRVWARLTAEIPRDASIAEKDVVVLVAADPGSLMYLVVQRRLAGEPAARRTYTLADSWDPVVLTRVDAHTLRLRPERGFLDDPISRLVRDPRDPLPVGVPIPCGVMTAMVESVTSDGRPASVLFRFDRELEDPTLYFVGNENGFYRHATLPKIGETVTLAGTPFL